MIDATLLPTLFSESTWQDGGAFLHNGRKLLASINGVWVETVDPDGVRVAEDDLLTIASAEPHIDGDGALLLGGAKKEIAARPLNNERWIWIKDPEAV